MNLRAMSVFTTACALGVVVSANAQYASPSPAAKTGHEGHAGMSGGTTGTPSLSAKLVDAEAKAKKQTAVVEVTVKGLNLIDSAKVNETPAKGQGHLHYQVDDGPVIATTAPKLAFHGLKPGAHSITVILAANDHTPLGPQEKLTVTVP